MKPTAIFRAAIFALAACAFAPAFADTSAAQTTAPATSKLQAALRQLWQGHVQGTRAYAIAVKAGDAAAAAAATKRVIANATQIADAVGGFYGETAGKQMLQLLAGHWSGVKALTDAAQKADAAAKQQAMHDLVANGKAIATFLSQANPYLTKDAVLGLLTMHVGHHAAQIDEIMRGDTQAEAKTWTAMQAHMNVLADALAAALAKQFPDKAA